MTGTISATFNNATLIPPSISTINDLSRVFLVHLTFRIPSSHVFTLSFPCVHIVNFIPHADSSHAHRSHIIPFAPRPSPSHFFVLRPGTLARSYYLSLFISVLFSAPNSAASHRVSNYIFVYSVLQRLTCRVITFNIRRTGGVGR